jgi:predicted ATPase
VQYKHHASLQIDGPSLDQVKINFSSTVDYGQYPFSLKIVKSLTDLKFPTQVTFLVGENGTGKSTILEAIACNAGLGSEGGSKNFSFNTTTNATQDPAQKLAEQMTLSWRCKPKNSYFFRAESFFNLASYIDTIAKEDNTIYSSYGGKSLHEQSHGESFFRIF